VLLPLAPGEEQSGDAMLRGLGHDFLTPRLSPATISSSGGLGKAPTTGYSAVLFQEGESPKDHPALIQEIGRIIAQ